jgi:hypothetical protein
MGTKLVLAELVSKQADEIRSLRVSLSRETNSVDRYARREGRHVQLLKEALPILEMANEGLTDVNPLIGKIKDALED